MKKAQITSEEKAINLIKRTSSDINQLYNELGTELSEEFLKSDDTVESDSIRKALDIITAQKEHFLTAAKNAIMILKKEEAEKEEEKLEVILEDKKEKAKVIQSGPLFQEEHF